ncbi:RNA polymerase sigma factor [Caballeronia sp. INML3B]
MEELPQKDIAEIMNLSVKAVESLLQRAKMNLRKKLSAVYEGKNINESLK